MGTFFSFRFEISLSLPPHPKSLASIASHHEIKKIT
jgi:hypothetical protein